MSILKEFKEFAMSNVVDLATGVIIGAFGKIVTSWSMTLLCR